MKSIRKSSKRKSPKKSVCKQRLSDKIKVNMKEWKDGKYKTQQQALAVSYAQIKKMFPHCKPHLSK